MDEIKDFSKSQRESSDRVVYHFICLIWCIYDASNWLSFDTLGRVAQVKLTELSNPNHPMDYKIRDFGAT